MKKTFLYSLAVLASLTLASCNGDYDDWAQPQHNPQEASAAKYGITFTAGPEAECNMPDEDGVINLVTVNSTDANVTGYTVKDLKVNGEAIKGEAVGNNIQVNATVKGFTEQGLYMLATILKSPMATATTIAIIDTFTKLRKLARTIDKVNEDAKEHGIYPDKNTEDKIQTAMNEVFADNLPLKMRKLTFGVNLGILKFSLETTRESKECRAYKKAVSE